VPEPAKEILVLGAEWREDARGTKGLFGGSRPRPLKLESLKGSFTSFFDSLGELMRDLPDGPGPFRLEEIEVTVAVSAEGSIALIGGVKAGATGGITLRLKR